MQILHDLAVDDVADNVGVIAQLVIVIDALLHIAAFDAGVERIGGIGRHFLTK